MQQLLGGGVAERLVVLGEISARDMKARQRILYKAGIHVAYEIVEMAKRRSALHRVFGALGDIESLCGHYTRNYAPYLAVVVADVILRILGLDDPGHLPDAIVAPLVGVVLKFLVTVLRDFVHVGHDDFRLGKDVAVDTLQNNLSLRKRIAVYG